MLLYPLSNLPLIQNNFYITHRHSDFIAIDMASQEILESVKKAIDDEHNPKRNFRQSVDIVVNLKDVDMSNPENRIDEEISLPGGRGENAKIGVFATSEMALKAKDVADIVFKPEDIEELAKDIKNAKGVAENYDFFIAEAPLMPTVGKFLGRFFGPRGKMPRPIPPTADILAEVEKLRNMVRIRSKDKITLHCLVGKEDMDAEVISGNIGAILKAVEEKLERGMMNVKSVYVKTTMGVSVRVV